MVAPKGCGALLEGTIFSMREGRLLDIVDYTRVIFGLREESSIYCGVRAGSTNGMCLCKDCARKEGYLW